MNCDVWRLCGKKGDSNFEKKKKKRKKKHFSEKNMNGVVQRKLKF
jgi:hypothetical protein